MPTALVNARTQRPIASEVELAETRAERRRGLLGRSGLAPSSALLLTPCFAAHTAFMRFAIDVAFIDRDGSVVKLVPHMRPWRMAVALRACSVVEFAAGTLEQHAVAVGDRLYLRPTYVGAERATRAEATDARSGPTAGSALGQFARAPRG